MGKTAEAEIRVRFADTDADGGVYHANYLTYFASGRHEILRGAGIDLNRLAREDGLRFVVVEATCRYRAVAYFDDVLIVRSQVERLGNSSVVLAYEVVRPETDGETLIASGTTAQVFIDKENKAVPMPQWIREALS